MTWPTPPETSQLDNDTDTLQNARPQIKGLADRLALLIAHVTAFMQGLLSSDTAADARATLDVPSRNGSGATGTSWGIGITGNAATATTAANVTRRVTGAGLATGGGLLYADRAITVTEATEAEANTGAGTGVVTARRLPAAIAALSSDVGVGQTWQPVTRTSGTDYQNTLGRTITLVVTFNGRGGQVRVGPSTATYVLVSGNTSSISDDSNSRPVHTVPIPPGDYYRINGTINNVKELR